MIRRAARVLVRFAPGELPGAASPAASREHAHAPPSPCALPPIPSPAHSPTHSPAHSPASPRKRALAGVLTVGLLGVLVYWPLVPGGRFVLSDHRDVAGNAALRSGMQGLVTIWAYPASQSPVRPLATSLLLLERQFFGPRVAGFRIVSIILHAICIMLLYRLLAALHPVPSRFWPPVAAGLFAAHPLHAQTLASASHQGMLLCAAFYLAGLIVWTNAIHRGRGHARDPMRRRAYLTLIPMTAAVLSHPIGLTFPLAAWVLARRLSRPVGVMFILAGVALGAGLMIHPPRELSLPAAAEATGFHALRLLWPAGPAMRFDRVEVSDHLLYLPCAVMVALAAFAIVRYARPPRGVLVGAAGVAIAALSLTTMSRATMFQSDETLWQAALRANPNSPRAHVQLGRALLREDPSRRHQAMAHLERALTIDPHHRDALLSLAAAHAEQRHWDLAVARYRQMLALHRHDAEAMLGLADAYAQQGRSGDALAMMQELIRHEPRNARAHLQMSSLYASRGEAPRALEHAERALQLSPRDPGVHIALAGLVFNHFGDARRAQTLLARARRLDPHSPEALLLAGAIQFELAKQHPPGEARADAYGTAAHFYRAAARLAPESAAAHRDLGIALAAAAAHTASRSARVDLLNDAIFCFERAEALHGPQPENRALRLAAVRQRDALLERVR